MIKDMIEEMLPNIWPMILFISVVTISLRIAFLIKSSKKVVVYKELLSLIFIIYILCLYYIVSYQDINYGGVNLIPFKEMFRYSFGSYKFIKNIIGNILLFIPYGFFATYFLSSKKITPVVIVTLIATLCIEIMQYYLGRVFDMDDIILNLIGGICGYFLYIGFHAIKIRMPKLFKEDGFINFIIILIIVIIILLAFNINVFDYL